MRIVHFLGFPGVELPAALRALPDLEFVAATEAPGFLELTTGADAIILSSPSYTPELAALLAQPRSKVRWIHFASAGYETAHELGVPPGILAWKTPLRHQLRDPMKARRPTSNPS